MITKTEILERAVEIGEAYGGSSSNSFPGDVVVDAYKKMKELAKAEGILSDEK